MPYNKIKHEIQNPGPANNAESVTRRENNRISAQMSPSTITSTILELVPGREAFRHERGEIVPYL